MKFAKPAISVDDQLDLLKQRGMTVPDEARARHYLKHISYYRLRAYWLPFEGEKQGDAHCFKDDTSFDDVLSLYVFDRQLRLLVMDAVERVEVAIRASWAHHMAMSHGPHGYLDQQHYSKVRHHASMVDSLTKEFDRSRDTFAEHYHTKYTDPTLPPVWMAAELMSFGLLSKFYGGLKSRAERQAIAKPLGLDEKVLTSFAHHMSHVRNICAHHGRLWNRRFTIQMIVPRYPARLAVAMKGADPRNIHNTLVTLDQMLRIVAAGTTWCDRVRALMADCAFANPKAMGFPEGWEQQPIWNATQGQEVVK